LNNLLLVVYGLIVIGVLALSLPFVFAETFEDSVKFPVPDNVKEMERVCKVKAISSLGLHFGCDWVFLFDSGGVEWFNELIIAQGLNQTESIPEEIIPDIPLIPSTFKEKPRELVQYERDLKKFNEKPPTRPADVEYYYLLQKWEECQRGTGPARGIQFEDTFITSKNTLSSLQSLDRAGGHDNLAKAVEACFAQQILEDELLGPEALYKGQYFGKVELSHTERAHYDKTEWAYIPTQQDYELDERDFLQENITAFDKMCASEFVNSSFKRMQGCIVKIVVKLNEDGTCREGSTYTEDKNACTTMTTAKRTDGFIPVNPTAPDVVKRYQQDQGVEQLEKILAKKRIVQQIEEAKIIREAK